MEKVVLAVIAVWYFYALLVQSSVVKRSTLACKDHEMSVECAYCGPKSCEDLGHPIPCGGATGICRPECVCIDGLVRDADGKCTPKAECPNGCAGDNNATTGCGNHCGNSCSDYMEVNKTCFSGCRYNSCDCKPGFVYHDGLKKCILPMDCLTHRIRNFDSSKPRAEMLCTRHQDDKKRGRGDRNYAEILPFNPEHSNVFTLLLGG